MYFNIFSNFFVNTFSLPLRLCALAQNYFDFEKKCSLFFSPFYFHLFMSEASKRQNSRVITASATALFTYLNFNIFAGNLMNNACLMTQRRSVVQSQDNIKRVKKTSPLWPFTRTLDGKDTQIPIIWVKVN